MVQLKRDLDMTTEITTNNESFETCASCGGDCCKTLPGIEWPERFLACQKPAEALANLLGSGRWVLAAHYGIPYDPATPPPDEVRFRKFYYPRPATTDEEGKGPHASATTGSCCFLGEHGCQLSFFERPRLCRELVPDKGLNCYSPVGKRDAALAWFNHQDLIEQCLKIMADA